MDGEKIVKLVLAFIVINAVLWFGQEIYYADDEREIETMETKLDTSKIEISKIESNLNSQQVNIENIEAEMVRLKSAGSISEYNSKVDMYNSMLTSYKNQLSEYQSKISNYNVQVEKVNELIESSGSRWYLLPIPLGSKSSRAKL